MIIDDYDFAEDIDEAVVFYESVSRSELFDYVKEKGLLLGSQLNTLGASAIYQALP